MSAIVADSNIVDAELLQLYLQMHFQHVAVEQSGEAVVKDVKDSLTNGVEVALVILNRTLDDNDGYEVARRIREAGYTGAIIGTCSEISPMIKSEWSALGCDTFLQKPISLASLTHALAEIDNS
jgi:DNA-binding response OmpR family regulator